MINKKYFFVLLLLIFGSVSCDDDFDNNDPNSPTRVESSQLLTDLSRQATNQLYSTFVGGDMGACWSQQWSKVQYNDEERFSPRSSVIITLWETFYEDVISDAKTMENLAVLEGNQVSEGVALVMQAYGYSILTDLYGDIPFTEAVRADEGIFAPAYDEQEVVYNGMLEMLDRADALLATNNGSLNPSFDPIYQGDAAKWRKFANSLKFRALMRVSAKLPSAASQMQAIVSSRPIFTSHADEAKVNYLGAQPNANPIYETIVYGVRGEFKISELMVNTLADLSDPRLPVYAQPNNAGVYRGKTAGIQNVPNDDFNYENVSAIGTRFLAEQFPGYMVSYSELLFLMAEAAHKGYISGSAASYYNAAISASMAENGLSDASSYLAQSSVAYTNDNSGLQKIHTQKWIALFCQGVEAWTEWRRTGFPVLQTVIDANPNVGVTPSRYTYPATEQTTNKANYDAAVASQGENRLTTKIWWME